MTSREYLYIKRRKTARRIVKSFCDMIAKSLVIHKDMPLTKLTDNENIIKMDGDKFIYQIPQE